MSTSESESEFEEEPLPHGVAGVVKQYNDHRGYGFIRVNGTYKSAFFHISAVPEKCIKVGDEVRFDLVKGPKGYIAESIEVLNLDGGDSDSEPDETVSQEALLDRNATGVVTQYLDGRGFGFIKVDETYSKVFFHLSDVLYKPLEVQDQVKFHLHKGPKGYFAESIKFLNLDGEDSDSEPDEAVDQEVLPDRNATGVVTQYLDGRGFGFIKVDETYSKVFFHLSDVLYQPLAVQDQVKFHLHKGPKGYFAKSIKVLNLDGENYDSEPDEAVDQEVLLDHSATGVVTEYKDGRGFGFIKANETYSRVFFHLSEVLYKPLEVQDPVKFHLYVGPKGNFANCINFDGLVEEDDDGNEIHFGQTSGSHGAKDGSNPAKATHTEKSDQPSNGAGQKTTHDTSKMSRVKGNTFFKSARDQESDIAKLDCFKSALECYKKASASSQSDDDLVSAEKNTGTVSWKLAKLKMNACPDERNVIHAYFKAALQHFGTAYTKRNCMVEDWANHLERSIKECLDDIRTWIEPRNDEDRIVALKEYVAYVPECDAKVRCYIRIANMYYRRGKDALQHEEYKSCQGYLDDCSTTLHEAKKRCTGADSSFKVNITALEKDVQRQTDSVQKCLSKAKDEQARRTQEEKDAREEAIAKEQLKGVLKTLEKYSKLPIDKFVERLYKHWPPKGIDESKIPCAASSSSSKSSQKKLLIRAISHYHPDKVDKCVHGVKWYLFSSEITKCLTLLLAEVNT